MGGLCWPVAPLMLRTRGAVHQPVSSLPSGWPSISPLYGISHLNNPSSLPCSSLSPSPTAPVLCLLCPRPSLVCSFPCLRSCFPTLAWAESSDPPLSNLHLPPNHHHIIAQCTPNAPGICGIVYVSEFWYSLAAFLITGMLMERWGACPHPPTTSSSSTTTSSCLSSQAHYPTC